nr:sigma factor [Burkholderia cenocepacia]
MLPRLRSFALRLTGNRHDAEELVQRACIRALERVHQLRPDTAPVSWVFSIAQSI